MSRIVLAFLLLTAGAALFSSGASAQSMNMNSPTPKNYRTVFLSCLAHTKDDAVLKRIGICVGGSGMICRRMKETGATVACDATQQEVWQKLLDGWYNQALAKLSGNAKTALEAAQKSWKAYRSAKCGYWAVHYGTGNFHTLVAGDCLREATGLRAIEMHEVLNDLSQ